MNYYNYFTEIEEHFVRRRGKHMWVSPMDWSLIATWRDAGVPLHVALRGIDIAMDTWHSKPRRGSQKLSTLFYCHDSVMAEYARHLEAHLGEGEPEEQKPGEPTAEKPAAEKPAGPDREMILRFLAQRIDEIKALRAKHSGCGSGEELARIRSRLEEVARSLESDDRPRLDALERDLGMLDELLVNCLKSMTAPEQMEAWEQEAKLELKVYKKRLPKETYQKILDNFRSGKVRRLHNVGELSLFQL